MFGIDLSARRIGIFSNNWHNTQLLRMMLRMLNAGEIVSFARRSDSNDYLKHNSVDAMICDWTDNGGATLVFMSEFRHGGWAYNPDAPVVIVGSGFTQRDVAIISATATHQILMRPFSVNDIAKKVAHAILGSLPNVATDDYVGPDRRRTRGHAPNGEDRRFEMMREEAVRYAAKKAEIIRSKTGAGAAAASSKADCAAA